MAFELAEEGDIFGLILAVVGLVIRDIIKDIGHLAVLYELVVDDLVGLLWGTVLLASQLLHLFLQPIVDFLSGPQSTIWARLISARFSSLRNLAAIICGSYLILSFSRSYSIRLKLAWSGFTSMELLKSMNCDEEGVTLRINASTSSFLRVWLRIYPMIEFSLEDTIERARLRGLDGEAVIFNIPAASY